MLQSLKNKVQTTIGKTGKSKKARNMIEYAEEDLMEGWTDIGEEKSKLQAVDEVHVQFVEDKPASENMGAFGFLSNIILVHLLSFTEDYDLCQLSCTSSAMNNIANNENIWERLYMREFVNNSNLNNNNNNDSARKKKAKMNYLAWNSQEECGGFKALYGTQYCEQRLITTLLALKDSTAPNSSDSNSKLDWICKPLVSAQNFFVATEVYTLMVGLDNAGKTAILHKLARGAIVPTTHTIGYNSEKVTRGDFVFDIRDLEFKLENPLVAWKQYYKNVQAVIFVVDCSDYGKISTAKISLQMLMRDKVFSELPLLVYANKRDVPGAMTTLQVITNLGLHNLVNKKGWHVQACSIVDDFGLHEGLDWLVSAFKNEEIEKLQAKMKKIVDK